MGFIFVAIYYPSGRNLRHSVHIQKCFPHTESLEDLYTWCQYAMAADLHISPADAQPQVKEYIYILQRQYVATSILHM